MHEDRLLDTLTIEFRTVLPDQNVSLKDEAIEAILSNAFVMLCHKKMEDGVLKIYIPEVL